MVVKNTFPKTLFSAAQVQHIHDDNMNFGAKACLLTQDAANYYLTTTW
jgi:hypothetical protein